MMIDLSAQGKRPRRSHIFDRDDHDFYVEPAWCSEKRLRQLPHLSCDPHIGAQSDIDGAD